MAMPTPIIHVPSQLAPIVTSPIIATPTITGGTWANATLTGATVDGVTPAQFDLLANGAKATCTATMTAFGTWADGATIVLPTIGSHTLKVTAAGDIDIVAGDRLTISLKNKTDATDVTVIHCNMNVERK